MYEITVCCRLAGEEYLVPTFSWTRLSGCGYPHQNVVFIEYYEENCYLGRICPVVRNKELILAVHSE
jgi:hypothetical protein